MIMTNKQTKHGLYILMTYRSSIQKVLPTTYYTSDSGWGCMLRVGQMAIANYLLHVLDVPYPTILALFWDNSDRIFSIQNITAASSVIFPQKKPFQWYSPSQMGFIVKHLLQAYSSEISVSICLDNSIFLSEISSHGQLLFVQVMIRVGLEEPEKIYLPVLQSLMTIKFFFAAMGGTPKHAHLFVQSKGKQVGYLDPHSTSSAAKTEEQLLKRQEENWGGPNWMKLKNIDSSMGLIFTMRREEKEQFWTQLQGVKQKHKQHFFLYIEKQRPEFNEDDLIEIVEFDE